MKVVILGGFGAQQTVFVEGIENQWLQNVLSKLLGLTLTTVFPKEKSLIKTPSWASQLPSTSRHFLFKHWGRRTFPKFPFKLGHSPIKPTNIAERSNLLANIFKPPEVTGQQSYIVCLSSGRALQSLSSQMAKSKSPVEPRLKVPKGRRAAEVRP